ncbi:WD40-repeat-containing domain protein [Armillaria nabsnona]|nr:WD40-repeat-containing domain protein [Armillaria nabsnona]
MNAPNFLDKNEFDLGIEGQSGPKGAVKDTARFNRLTWGYVDSSRPRGVIVAGMENGELALWNPAKILAGAESVYDPMKLYVPTSGSRSTDLDEITSVAWNQQAPYVLAGASTTGYAIVWDLRGKRDVVALAYGGGAGKLAGQVSATNGLAVGGRRGMSAIAWHPDNATRPVSASEDVSSPIIMVWDLCNVCAPEKILTGHEQGVLSLFWSKQDADMLLSWGKDNRALCWNPQTSEIICELPSTSNWLFQVEWCPRNPDLLATALFDGTVGIHSIQSTLCIGGHISRECGRSKRLAVECKIIGLDDQNFPWTIYLHCLSSST